MKSLQPSAPTSDRTRRAVQDYTAINTILTAIEMVQGTDHARQHADPLALAIVGAFVEHGHTVERTRLRFNCPLGRRAQALGMLRSGASTVAGVVKARGL